MECWRDQFVICYTNTWCESVRYNLAAFWNTTEEFILYLSSSSGYGSGVTRVQIIAIYKAHCLSLYRKRCTDARAHDEASTLLSGLTLMVWHDLDIRVTMVYLPNESLISFGFYRTRLISTELYRNGIHSIHSTKVVWFIHPLLFRGISVEWTYHDKIVPVFVCALHIRFMVKWSWGIQAMWEIRKLCLSSDHHHIYSEGIQIKSWRCVD